MPRIRKKTTKRGTTNQREKIKHKAAETRKKNKKADKKNVQWKSKHKKDPGIPNNFPYKDQILAEVAEERRQAEEAKQLKKELKKAAKANANATAEVEDGSDNEEEQGGFDGISALLAGKLASGSKKGKAAVVEAETEAEEAPVLINPDWPHLKAVLSIADVVIEILDARDPLAYRLKHVEELVKEKAGQKLLFVLNKIDTCPRESVSAWATALRAEHPAVLFRSGSAFLPSADVALAPVPVKGKGKERADDALGLDSALSVLEKWAGEKDGDEPLAVAVVGLTNTGKSSFVNSLVRKAAVPIYKLSSTQDGPTTTAHAQEIALEVAGKSIRLIDTPGAAWVHAEGLSEDELLALRSRDILARSKGRIDRLKDPEPAVHEIVTRASREDLMLFYNLPAFADKDTTAFLAALARVQGYIKKAGALDVAASARIVLRDWATGKLPRYTVAASASTSETAPTEPWLAELYSKDEAALMTLTPRKELRRSTGLVKLVVSTVDARKVDIEASWLPSEEDEEEDDEEEGDEDEDAEVDGSEEEEDEDEEDELDDDNMDEDEEDEAPVHPTGKRKRGAAPVAGSPPAKKVAFAPEPKNTRQARSAAGARGAAVFAARQAKKAEKPAAKAAKPPKSKPATVKAALKPAPTKKAANSAPSKKAAAENKSGEEVYDFKKFF